MHLQFNQRMRNFSAITITGCLILRDNVSQASDHSSIPHYRGFQRISANFSFLDHIYNKPTLYNQVNDFHAILNDNSGSPGVVLTPDIASIRPCTCTGFRMYTHKHTLSHSQTHTNRHSHTHTDSLTYYHTDTNTDTNKHSHKHTHKQKLKNTYFHLKFSNL